MESYTQVRRNIKKECRARVTTQLGHCISIRFLYSVPFVLLTLILYITVFGRLFYILLTGGADDRMMEAAITSGMGSNTVWLVLLLMIVLSGPLTYGLMQFYITLQRGGKPEVSTLVRPFTAVRTFWASIRMSACLSARAFLWVLLPLMCVSFATAGVLLLAWQLDEWILDIIIYVLLLLFLLPVVIKLQTYNAGWVVLHDGDEEQGAWAATAKGASVFHGQYGKVFTFFFSFAGWYILQYALTYLCVYLGFYGLEEIGGAMGTSVAVLAGLALLCISIILDAFLTAYRTTSFIGLYAYFEKLPPTFARVGYDASQSVFYQHTNDKTDQPEDGQSK